MTRMNAAGLTTESSLSNVQYVPGIRADSTDVKIPASLFSSSGGLNGTLTVPALSGFTQGNVASTRFVTEYAGKALVIGDTSTSGGTQIHGIYKAVPGGSTYRVAILAQWSPKKSNYLFPVFGWRQSSDGKLVVFDPLPNADTYERQHWASLTSRSSANSVTYAAFPAQVLYYHPHIWIGLRIDATNVYFEISHDGVYWQTVSSYAKSGAYISSFDQIFIGIFQESTTGVPFELAIRCYDESGASRTY